MPMADDVDRVLGRHYVAPIQELARLTIHREALTVAEITAALELPLMEQPNVGSAVRILIDEGWLEACVIRDGGCQIPVVRRPRSR